MKHFLLYKLNLLHCIICVSLYAHHVVMICNISTINYVMNSRFANTISNAINNISAHYDISNEMFAAFLSSDMTYSSAVFANEEESLEEAQYRKLRMMINKAKISKDDHVLEI